jgi:peptide-methionine (S)-S-oxide reductase
VGYAGGTTSNPEYTSIGDHSEAIEIVYDPTRISYSDLLNVFWNSHDPTLPSLSRQYRSIIFYHDEEQKRAALESKQREELRLGKAVVTDIVPVSQFYQAELYHQKYYLQHVPELSEDLLAISLSHEDMTDSTALARLNGYVGGYGSLETLKEQLNNLGLSEAGKKKILEIAEIGLSPACPVRY